jgi:hypothetical protein
VFFGDVDAIAQQREQALLDAYAAHPERFVAGPPVVKRPPEHVFICLSNRDGVPPTAAHVLTASDQELAAIWPLASSSSPVIHIPGAAPAVFAT